MEMTSELAWTVLFGRHGKRQNGRSRHSTATALRGRSSVARRRRATAASESAVKRRTPDPLTTCDARPRARSNPIPEIV
jgi:hypothetical protein